MTQEKDRDTAPPGKERPGPRISGRVNPEVGSSPKSPTGVKAIPRQCWRNAFDRHADAWREGFAYGFRDALRLIRREVDDPHMRLILSQLADRYGVEPHAATGGDNR